MKENKLLAGILVLLLAAGYASWTHEDSTTKDVDDKVAIASASLDDIKGLSMITRTQTVTMSRREDASAKKSYQWFNVESPGGKRAFAGNDTVKSLLEGFAPFNALRSLGPALPEKELAEIKLDHPQAKLVLRMAHGDRVFEIGGRTYGSRDYYVRPSGNKEVYLVASKVLSDLEFPEGRFMQRKLREGDLKDVSTVVLKAGGKEKKLLHKNRLSAKDAFWANPDKPDERSETIENYVHKLDSLAATKYAPDEKPFPKGDPVVEIAWYEDEKLLDTMFLTRTGTGNNTSYYAQSGATHQPAEVSRTSAEQIERDLATVF